MSEQGDPGQRPPDDQPPASPFPESSLGQHPEQPADAGLWAQPQAPSQPQPPEAPPAPVSPPAVPSGLSSGDPLAGSYPQGYTSPPPPGAGGAPPPIAGLPTTQPGALPGQYVLSGWWRRVGAAVVDGIIVSTVAFAIMAAIGVGFFASDFNSDAEIAALIGAALAGLAIFAIVALAYAPVMMGATNGKTLGRMVTGIRVVRANGQPITFGFAALREVVVKTLLVGIVSQFTIGLVWLLDVLWPLWDDENRALHDYVVNTRTIRD